MLVDIETASDHRLSNDQMDGYQDRLYAILEETIEAARRGEYAD